MASYLNFGFVPQDMSPIQGVNKLLPGHYLKVDLKRRSQIGQLWSLSSSLESPQEMTIKQAKEEFGHLLEESVKQVSETTDHLGALLSENLGSTTLNWLLSRLVPRDKISPYGVSFGEVSLSRSQTIANQFGLSYQSKELTLEDALTYLVPTVWHLDEPIADPYAIRTWHLAITAADISPFAISPLGWEEMLAGHPRYFTYGKEFSRNPPFAHTLANLPTGLRDNMLMPLLRLLRQSYRYRILRNIDIDRRHVTYLLNSALFRGSNRKNASPFLYPFFDPEVFTQRFHRLSSLPGKLNPSLYFDMKTSLPDNLLSQYDHLFGAHKVTLLSPFLDNKLLEFTTRIPESIKFNEQTPGYLLENLMETLSPNFPRFPTPPPTFFAKWAQSDTMRLIFATLEKGRLVEEGILSKKWVHAQVSYPNLTGGGFEQLWAILVLEIWFRLFINRPIGMQSHEVSVEELLGVTLKLNR